MGFWSNAFGSNIGKVDTPVSTEDSSNTSAGTGANVIVQEIYFIRGVGVVLVVEVTEGTLKPNQSAFVNGQKIFVNTIEFNHKQLGFAQVGQKVGVSIRGGGKELFAKGQTLSFS